MPFTFSHPALILPFHKVSPRWVSFTGLVVGSLVPDLDHSIQLLHNAGHSFRGLFYFDLPLGLLTSFLFHNIIRNSLYNNLPAPIAARLLPYGTFRWNAHFRDHWGAVIASVLAGACSHIFWDSFTHPFGYFVSVIPWLKSTIFIFGINLETYYAIQYVSSLAGAVIICFFILRLPADRKASRQVSGYYWPLLLLITVVATASLLNFTRHGGPLFGPAISAFFIALILTPIFDRKKYSQ